MLAKIEIEIEKKHYKLNKGKCHIVAYSSSIEVDILNQKNIVSYNVSIKEKYNKKQEIIDANKIIALKNSNDTLDDLADAYIYDFEKNIRKENNIVMLQLDGCSPIGVEKIVDYLMVREYNNNETIILFLLWSSYTDIFDLEMIKTFELNELNKTLGEHKSFKILD